jgi:flagellar hook-associated protein 1
MSLFSSIGMANNTLRAQQIGLQVAGQNIANANTPGYIREEVIFQAAPTQRYGKLLLGLGVEVQAIVQKSDAFLNQRLREAISEQTGAEVNENTYTQLETLFGELSDKDLSTSLNNFFNSISEILNQPESDAARNLAVLKGKTLANDINRLADRVGTIGDGLNERVQNSVDDINRLVESIRQLNIKIAYSEGGDISKSEAVGLRDQRNQSLTELAKLINIDVVEQQSGAVSVFVGGDYLVLEGEARTVKATAETSRGKTTYNIRMTDSDSPLQITGGEVAGLINSRDNVVGAFLDNLDQFASSLANEFNKVFSSGQGLKGYTSLTSENGVDSTTASLDQAGLTFTPVNGSFDILIKDKTTGLTTTTSIRIDLNGLDADTSLTDLVSQLNAVTGLTASIGPSNKVVLGTEAGNQEFAFSNDTSGVLASLGLNTFFTGSDALGFGVNANITADPTKFAASRGGIAADTKTAIDLASFLDRPLESKNGSSLSELYDRMTADLTQGSTISKSVAEGARIFADNLNGQQLALSGVNIDEEAIKMLRFQRIFQASARYISVLDELLGILVNI